MVAAGFPVASTCARAGDLGENPLTGGPAQRERRPTGGPH
jgi:hypothetical protein